MLFSSLSTPKSAVAGVHVSWREGVHIDVGEGPGVWCDAAHRRDLCFISSAPLLKGVQRTDSLLCSERTFRLYESLHDSASKPDSALLSPPGRPFQLGSLRLELFPSGSLPGASSLWLRTPSGIEVVYAGSPNPAPRATVEKMQVRGAECLIVHAPLAACATDLPTREEALSALREHMEKAQADGAILVVLCSALSTAPELIHALRSETGDAAPLFAGLSLFAHAQILQTCAAYRRVGALPDHLPTSAPPLRRLAKDLLPASVVFWPLGVGLEPLVTLGAAAAANHPGRASLRIVVCSAAAILPGACASLFAQLAALGLPTPHGIAFPDAIDRAGLLRYVRDTGSRRVVLTAGACADLAAALSPATCEALGPPSQLRLF